MARSRRVRDDRGPMRLRACHQNAGPSQATGEIRESAMKTSTTRPAPRFAILSVMLLALATSCASVPTRSKTSSTDSPPPTHDRDGRAQGGIAVWNTTW